MVPFTFGSSQSSSPLGANPSPAEQLGIPVTDDTNMYNPAIEAALFRARVDSEIERSRRRRYEERARESLRAAAGQSGLDRACLKCGTNTHVSASGTLCRNCGNHPRYPTHSEHRSSPANDRAAFSGIWPPDLTSVVATSASSSGEPLEIEYTPAGFGRIVDVR